MSHVVEEDAIGGDEVVLDHGQVQRELQDPVAITLLCWVYRSSPYSTRGPDPTALLGSAEHMRKDFFLT
jgi:hypothetical protein